MADKDITMAAIFFGIVFLSLVINMMFVIVVCRRRRLQTGYYLILSSLALADVIIAGTWTCLSAVTTLKGWDIPGEVCRFQSFMLTLSQTLTAFILASIGIERLLRMMKPSQHAVIYVPKIVTFMILGLLVFCGVMSSIHLYGYMPVIWMAKQWQCGAQFTESTRLLDLTFSFDHAIPYWGLAFPAFVVSYIKIFLAKRSSSTSGEIILERNSYAPGDSYSNRLHKLQSKFRPKLNTDNANMKKKPTLGKREYRKMGYTEPEHWDSDIENGVDSAMEDARQRVHLLPRPEFMALVTASLAALITAIMWLPWVIVRFKWNRTPYESVPDWFEVLAIVMMHSAAFVKPVVYFIVNPYYRSAVIKTMRCC